MMQSGWQGVLKGRGAAFLDAETKKDKGERWTRALIP